MHQPPFKVLIVGCGLGGLSCAIACRREGLEVEILEKSKELKEVGAGISAPPNANRVLAYYGLMEKLDSAGAVHIKNQNLLRYSNGELITARHIGDEWFTEQIGHSSYIHRADYHRVLLNEALRLGVTLQLGSDVQTVDFESPSATLDTRASISADVVVVADGTWSTIRDQLLGYHHKLTETGDLAYRATISRRDIEKLEDQSVRSLIKEPRQFVWIGPNKHAVFYPISKCTEYNLVLLRPDDIPIGVHKVVGDVQEMRATFEGWDPRLTAIISRVKKVDKWKIVTMDELETWVKGSIALLGDACHPTAPYLAQGAAMAVEDGAVLGILLGLLFRNALTSSRNRKSSIQAILMLYEKIRKERTTINVQGANEMRMFFHTEDGPEQQARDADLRKADLRDPAKQSKWGWGNMEKTKDLLGFDTIADAMKKFWVWAEAEG